MQVLVHGFTYTGQYWDFPDPTGGTTRYSYVASANRAGFATVALDLIGTGRSSYPPSAAVSYDQQAWVVHQVVQALRAVLSSERARTARSCASSSRPLLRLGDQLGGTEPLSRRGCGDPHGRRRHAR